jgi:hypothetical protein
LALERAASLNVRSGSARNLSSSWGMLVSVMVCLPSSFGYGMCSLA